MQQNRETFYESERQGVAPPRLGTRPQLAWHSAPLVPVSVYGLLWIPLNVRLGDGWVSVMNALTVGVVALAAVAYFSRDRRVRGVATLAYVAVTFCGVVWVWSPGAAS